ncbi:apolipo protein O-domain-containing protein [Blyttiomyces helicus]|uniref:MICOS complex subunit n=1 Tax=Blyttiomyces helicus TaxID=388810 RepID=A0A4P9W774_9FUNG|nr:apolipo protein O-domain-containing protein [Blyttiomyces helicus]|eukprot:RKO87243.1 apolipo protein O-domain-containing protein [Blyttiomyces helicus]
MQMAEASSLRGSGPPNTMVLLLRAESSTTSTPFQLDNVEDHPTPPVMSSLLRTAKLSRHLTNSHPLLLPIKKPLFALFGAAAVSSPSLAFAEQGARGYVPPRQKPSIYDEPEFHPVVVEEPSKLELAIRETRYTVTDYFSSTRANVQTLVDRWISLERQITATVNEYTVPSEPFLPGALYVTVAGFAGSILARSRSFPLRFLSPLTLASGTFVYLYPRTAQNVYDRAPAAIQKQLELLQGGPEETGPAAAAHIKPIPDVKSG